MRMTTGGHFALEGVEVAAGSAGKPMQSRVMLWN
jgi:hypothetical protein